MKKMNQKEGNMSIILFTLLLLTSFLNAQENRSAYSVPLSIPIYNSSNSAHALVSNRAGLDAVRLNSSGKTAIFLEPGDYDLSSAVKIEGGTAEEPRWFLLAGGGTAHPASLSDAQQANVKLIFDGSYLRIHRLSFLDYMINQSGITGWETNWIECSDIVIDKCYLREFQEGIYFRPGTKDNVVQNTRFEMVWNNPSLSMDRVGIVLNSTEEYPMTGTKILNNEFVNCIDAIQPLSQNNIEVDYGGTIIDNNLMWYDSRAVGHAGLENYLDFKDGGTVNNPMIVSNNIGWGLEIDGIGDGSAIPIHYGAMHIKFSNNIFTARSTVISISDPNVNTNLAASYIEFKDNVFLSTGGNAIQTWNSDHNTYDGNTIKCEGNTWYLTNTANDLNTNHTFKNNVIVNAEAANRLVGIDAGAVNENNSFYGSTLESDAILNSSIGVGNQWFNPVDAGLVDYTITYDVYSGSPQNKTFFKSVPPGFGGDTLTEAPVITLNGDNPMELTVGDPYSEPGATVTDNVDAGLTATITGSVLCGVVWCADRALVRGGESPLCAR